MKESETVTVDVKNTGTKTGKEVIQLYVGKQDGNVIRNDGIYDGRNASSCGTDVCTRN